MGEPSLCHHCNAPVPKLGDQFCCAGCELIHQFLNEENATAEQWGLRPQALAKDEFENLASDEALTLYVSSGTGHHRESRAAPRTRLIIDGFHCAGCQSALARITDVLPAVKSLEWNAIDAVLTVEWSETSRPVLAELGELLSRWGFRFRFLKTTDNVDESRQQKRQKDLVRLTVAGGIASNIMLFAICIYAGADEPWHTAFNWISGGLFLPLFLWGAIPFYQGAWQAITSRNLNLDFPLTFAFITGSLLSYQQLLTHGTEIYFDSLAGFLFLILVSRYLLNMSQRDSVENHPLEVFFDRSLFLYRRNGVERRGPIGDIIPGDQVLVPASARIPVDGTLIGNPVEVDTSYLTGEAQSHWVLGGGALRAGSRILTNDAWIQVDRTGAKTDLGNLLISVRTETQNLPLHPVITNRVSQILTLIVLSIAAGLLLYFWPNNPTEGFRRAYSLLILACPCAIAFGTPLALAQGLKLAFKEGLLVRSALIFDRLHQIRRIAFDKTGTLTTGQLRLSQHSPMLDGDYKKIILSLEAISSHPIASALRRAWGAIIPSPLQNLKEIPGDGPQGQFEGHTYQIRSAQDQDHTAGPGMDFIKDGQSVLSLYFEDDVRPESQPIVQKLVEEKKEVFVFSGDALPRALALTKHLPINPANIFGSLKPEQKRALIEEKRIDLYVGDGTNDVSSLHQAPVSVAMPGAVLEAQLHADVILLGGGLELLPRLFDLSNATQKTLRRNLVLALIYNFSAGILAVTGQVGPLGAAVLMPISSVIILLSSLAINWRKP